MKTIILIPLLILGHFAMTQNITKQVADTVCACITEKAVLTNRENLNDSLNACIGMAMALNHDALFEENKMESMTVENIWELKSRILAILEKKCAIIKELKKK